MKPLLFASLMLPASLLAQSPAWLDRLQSLPHPDSCRAYLFRLTEEPHVAGTEEDYATAEYVLAQFTAFGLPAELNEYEVYLPYPVQVEFEIVQPIQFRGPTPETGYPADKDSYSPEVILPFNAYSPDGEVQAQVVYANYGLPADYEALETMSIAVRNRVVLVRYGRSYRGVKVELAAQRGARGIILYSDPADDGYMKGDIYPHGPMRPPTAVQRGSIQYLQTYPGDPLTPGWAATATARRLKPVEATNLPPIPCLPLSYHDAEKVLRNLSGPNVPDGWQGGLPFAYHVGPGPAEIRMAVQSEFMVRPIWNVIATIPGATQPDLQVVVGNHRDAWTYGAVDPSSGTAVLLEVARTFGELLKQGYQPRRTIILASWDGEEFGLLGSTEWVEDHAATVARNTVAYVNVDVAVAGNRFGASASPSLWPFVQRMTGMVRDPRTNRPVVSTWWQNQNEKKKDAVEPAWDRIDSVAVGVNDLGGGSDYVAFLDFAGVSCLSMGFGGKYGVYHSLYDSFYWMEKFGDPTFAYHAAMARLAGVTILQLAESPAVPLDLLSFANALARQTQSVRKLLQEERNAVDSPTGLDDLWREITSWVTVAEELDSLQAFVAELDEIEIDTLNRALMAVERAFISPEGLPGREWFKNLYVAPGKHTGYAALTLPGLREAIEEKDWNRLLQEETRLLDCVAKARELSQAAVAVIKQREARE